MSNNKSSKLGLGLGSVAAAAAAAAGAFFFYGSPDAAKHRKQMKSWMVKAKGDVMEQLENLGDVTEQSYKSVVNDVMQKYRQAKHIDPQELAAITAELQQAWKKISGHLTAGTKPKKKAKKTAAKKK